jgi:hypothetical protein
VSASAACASSAAAGGSSAAAGDSAAAAGGSFAAAGVSTAVADASSAATDGSSAAAGASSAAAGASPAAAGVSSAAAGTSSAAAGGFSAAAGGSSAAAGDSAAVAAGASSVAAGASSAVDGFLAAVGSTWIAVGPGSALFICADFMSCSCTRVCLMLHARFNHLTSLRCPLLMVVLLNLDVSQPLVRFAMCHLIQPLLSWPFSFASLCSAYFHFRTILVIASCLLSSSAAGAVGSCSRSSPGSSSGCSWYLGSKAGSSLVDSLLTRVAEEAVAFC